MIEGKKISQLGTVQTLQDGCCFPVLSRGATKRITFSALIDNIIERLSGINNEEIEKIKEKLQEHETEINALLEKDYNIEELIKNVNFQIDGQNKTIYEYTVSFNELERKIEETHFDDVLELEEQVRTNATSITSIEEKIPAQASAENKLADSAAVKRKQDALTQTQLNAVNSGITAEKVAQYDAGMSPAGIVNLIYPIGSVYLSINNVNPSTLFGGTWKAVSEGRVLQGVSEGQTGGDTIEAGLPNIKGWFGSAGTRRAQLSEGEGAFTPYDYGPSRYGDNSTSSYGGSSFDASNGECKTDGSYKASTDYKVFGKSDTVQPPAFLVYIWKRTA